MLNLSAVPVAADQWLETPGSPYAFRVWRNRLYRREMGELYFGGYQIKYVSLANVRLVAEWLAMADRTGLDVNGRTLAEQVRAGNAWTGDGRD